MARTRRHRLTSGLSLLCGAAFWVAACQPAPPSEQEQSQATASLSTSTRLWIDDGRMVLETFDYRGEDSFEMFAAGLEATFDVELKPPPEGKAYPREFTYDGETLVATWEDEYGSHITGRTSQAGVIEKMQDIILNGPASGD